MSFPYCTKKNDLGNSPLNPDISIFGFALNNSSKKFGTRLEMEMDGSISPLSLMPLLVPVRHSEILLLLGN